MVPYTLIRSKSRKKSINMRVTVDGVLEVRAPVRVSEKMIQNSILENKEWIEARMLKVGQFQKFRPTFVTGDTLQFLGSEYYLQVDEEVSRKKSTVVFSNENGFIVKIPQTAEPSLETKRVLEKWYRKEAKKYITEKSKFMAQNIHETFNEIRVKDNRTRWGSCSSKRNLNFNWRLIFTRKPIIDYVVIHEVCHLKEPNHKKGFWNLVESLDPDYKKHQLWLKEHFFQLTW